MANLGWLQKTNRVVTTPANFKQGPWRSLSLVPRKHRWTPSSLVCVNCRQCSMVCAPLRKCHIRNTDFAGWRQTTYSAHLGIGNIAKGDFKTFGPSISCFPSNILGIGDPPDSIYGRTGLICSPSDNISGLTFQGYVGHKIRDIRSSLTSVVCPYLRVK